MLAKNITETVNVNGESIINRDNWIIDKIMTNPHTVTIPPSKTCTTGTRSQSLWVSIIEDDPATGVLQEGTVGNNMSWVVAKGTETVWAEARGVTEAVAKRTVIAGATILGVTRGALTTVGTLIFWTVDTKMPCEVTVKTTSLVSRLGFWAQAGISRCNSGGVRGGSALMECRTRVSGDI